MLVYYQSISLYKYTIQTIMRNHRNIWCFNLKFNVIFHKKKILVQTQDRAYTAFNMITVCDTTVTLGLAVTTIRRITTFDFTIFSMESNFTGYTCTYKYLCYLNLYKYVIGTL